MKWPRGPSSSLLGRTCSVGALLLAAGCASSTAPSVSPPTPTWTPATSLVDGCLDIQWAVDDSFTSGADVTPVAEYEYFAGLLEEFSVALPERDRRLVLDWADAARDAGLSGTDPWNTDPDTTDPASADPAKSIGSRWWEAYDEVEYACESRGTKLP